MPVDAEQTVRQCWRDVSHGVVSDPTGGARLEDEIIAAHMEPTRHYHGLEHIAALVNMQCQHGRESRCQRAISLAILFHDIVYDARRADNEMRSASVARDRLSRIGVPTDIVETVVRFIEATRHGIDAAPTGDDDLDLFLDLDLSILASEPAIYLRYVADVRREYAFVPDAAWREGRGKVLRSFLDRSHIYRTSRLLQLWETPARENLRTELATLTGS